MNIFKCETDLEFVLRKYITNVCKLMNDKHNASVVYAGHEERKDGSIEVFMLPIMTSGEFRSQKLASAVVSREALISIAVDNNVPIMSKRPKLI